MSDNTLSQTSILIIDAKPERRTMLASFVGRKYHCEVADNFSSAADLIRTKEFATVMALPPSVSEGTAFVEFLSAVTPQPTLIFIINDQKGYDTAKAFKLGVYEVIQMPFTMNHIEMAVDSAVKKYRTERANGDLNKQVEEVVVKRTADLELTLENLKNAYRSTLRAMIIALDARDLETRGHSDRVVKYSLRLGREMGLDTMQLNDLEFGALLHDIGKINIPDEILRKPDKLNAEEWTKMRNHPQHGERILKDIPFLDGARRVVSQHHEKWDGSGYPLGLKGDQIDLGARIFSVVDAFDAMMSDRVYRKGRTYGAAANELREYAGTQFDPAVVNAFLNIPESEWSELQGQAFRSVSTGVLSKEFLTESAEREPVPA